MKTLRHKIQRRAGQSADDAVLPMINIVFLLLIFFMIAGKLSPSDPFPLELSSSRSQTLGDPKVIELHLSPKGLLFFEGRLLQQSEFLNSVKQALSTHPKTQFRLRVDQGHKAGEILSLLALLKKEGLEKVNIATELVPVQ